MASTSKTSSSTAMVHTGGSGATSTALTTPGEAPAVTARRSSGTLTSKLKAVATAATTSVSAFASSPQDAESAHSGVMSKFYNVKRRMTESMLSSVGKAEKTADSEYEARRANIVRLEGNMKDVYARITAYIDATRAMCFASSELGANIRDAYSGCDPRHAHTVDTYASLLASLDGSLRPGMDVTLVRDVLDPLKARLADMESLRKAMRERELVKVDFDARTRKVRLMKEKGSGGDAQKLLYKEEKLRKTGELLAQLTHALYARFDEVEAARHSMFAPTLRHFTAAQRTFFGEGLRLISSLPDIPEMAAAPLSTVGGAPHMDAGYTASDYPPSKPAAAAMYAPSAATAMPHGGASAPAAAAAAGGDAYPAAVPVDAPHATGGTTRVQAMYAYKPTNADELELSVGDVLSVLESHADGWMKGARKVDGRVGFFPANHVAPM